MDQGLIANPKDLERMQGELESLQRRITSLEDDELEVMARLEDAEKELDSLTQGSPTPTSGWPSSAAPATTGPRSSTATCETVAADRGPTVGRHPRRPAGALRQAAGLQERRGRGCAAGPRVQRLPAHARPDRDRRDPAAPADEVIRYEECQRILVRTPESGL